MEKKKFNVWAFNPKNMNATGGWDYFVTITARNEEESLNKVSREYNKPLYSLKSYPHIDSMGSVA